ncbi:unnamed protein product [Caretta caretta]
MRAGASLELRERKQLSAQAVRWSQPGKAIGSRGEDTEQGAGGSDSVWVSLLLSPCTSADACKAVTPGTPTSELAFLSGKVGWMDRALDKSFLIALPCCPPPPPADTAPAAPRLELV